MSRTPKQDALREAQSLSNSIAATVYVCRRGREYMAVQPTDAAYRWPSTGYSVPGWHTAATVTPAGL